MPSNADEVARNIGKFGDKIEQDLEHGLESVGEFLAKKMADRIYNNTPPALKPATIKAKGSSHTLVDSGEMAEDVTHKMEGKDTVKVGVFGEPALRAAVHELGAPSKNIPARSFARPALKENQAGIIKILTQK